MEARLQKTSTHTDPYIPEGKKRNDEKEIHDNQNHKRVRMYDSGMCA